MPSVSHIVIGDEHADTAIFQKLDDFLNVDHRDRIDARERLIEQNKPRLYRERACNLDASPLSARQADRGAVAQVRNVQIVQQGVAFGFDFLRCQIAQFEHRLNIFGDGELAKNGRFLRQIRKPQTGSSKNRQMRQVVSIQKYATAIHRYQTDDHVKTCCLAGAVRSQQTDHLATLDRKRNIADDGALSIRFAQAIDAQYAFRGKHIVAGDG